MLIIKKVTPGFAALALSIVMAVTIFTACTSLQPGADPLVVRTEQLETVAKTTFDAVLKVDHTDRGFWRTNAPAFHKFCEWLRQTQVIGNKQLPRASAMILTLDNIKVDYKAGRASSNALVTAVTTLQGTLTAANSWLSITTTNLIHP